MELPFFSEMPTVETAVQNHLEALEVGDFMWHYELSLVLDRGELAFWYGRHSDRDYHNNLTVTYYVQGDAFRRVVH
jgi:hypothetical protein